MEKVIIFLDIDGVFCTRNSLNEAWKKLEELVKS